LNDLDELTTEAGGTAEIDYELRPTVELVEAMNAEDATVADAVGAVSTELAAAVDAIVERLASGGRLVYIGAGTSGGLAALDAQECTTTFSAPPGQVLALAASDPALEDDRGAGAAAVEEAAVTGGDAVVGLSASGRTPYVLGGLEAASQAGALTVAVVSVDGAELSQLADQTIAIVVGPEFIAGSTRLKAGTAQKLVLNTISSVSMIRLGKTFGNLMVDVAPENEKLRARVHRIVRTATGAAPAEVEAALQESGGDAKVAIVALLGAVDAQTARARLHDAKGNVRLALGP
jgi:N-acetylmuramic acid 6-phosphate etherase